MNDEEIKVLRGLVVEWKANRDLAYKEAERQMAKAQHFSAHAGQLESKLDRIEKDRVTADPPPDPDWNAIGPGPT